MDDTTVAVNPEDEKIREVTGKTVILPIIDRGNPDYSWIPYVDSGIWHRCCKR